MGRTPAEEGGDVNTRNRHGVGEYVYLSTDRDNERLLLSAVARGTETVLLTYVDANGVLPWKGADIATIARRPLGVHPHEYRRMRRAFAELIESGRLYCDAEGWRIRGFVTNAEVECARASWCNAERNRARYHHRDEVYARDGHACVYCGARSDLTLDHVVPLSKGGSNELENLATACRPCNSSKGARVLS